ncbi:hypothetical protein E5K66_07040 [Helicobacter pylori]|nr:hypothetical protein E5K66_07040 [Helicobacter pylori]
MMFSLFGKNKNHEFLESYFNGAKRHTKQNNDAYKTESIIKNASKIDILL